ncbi:hypothetical protein MPSEU_000983700 [Mayamaea pseudoterrestris]|nr:hypothetical protein MPSEU_000983700 [Mayamaea pseudoterrestris]
MSNDEITIHLSVTGAEGSPRVPIQVPSNISALDLLKRVSDSTKIPPGTLKLIFRGRLIASDATKIAVQEYKMEDGSVLHCMGKPAVQAESATAVTTQEVNSAVSAAAATLPVASASMMTAPAPIRFPSVAAAAVTAQPLTPNDPLLAALQAMRASNSPADYQTAVQVLDKLLFNILEHPLEEKYRRVKKENPAFARRLGNLVGGDAVLLAAGFVSETDAESGAPVYVMHANADAWQKLQETKTKVERAVQQVNAARNITSNMPLAPAGATGLPSLLPPGGGLPGLGANMPPDMNNIQAAIMRDPALLQSMMQNPMIQNMMMNDPRVANNPMMRQAFQQMANNPQMLAQMTQLMQDPQAMQRMQAMMQDPRAMQQMQAMGMPVGGFASMMPSAAGESNIANRNAAPRQPGGASDQELTEEEMIAEAIRRSLEDQHPPS